MSKLYTLTFIAISMLAGCKSEQKNKTETAVTQADPASSSQAAEGPEIPGVPKDVMVKLLNECTYVDYIFHELPFSLSQSEDPSIDQNISFIDFNKPLGRIPKNCKAIARKFFQIKGEIVYDVDVYLTNECKFYVFVDKKNQPLYANYMTEAGVKFYSQIAQQARGAIQQKQ